MEPKVIIYIVVGILYFFFSIYKKAQEKKELPVPQDTAKPPKPVSPPVAKPLEDIMREVKRKQAEIEAKKKLPAPKPFVSQQKKAEKEILVRQVKPATMGEGTSENQPVYERELTSEEKIPRGNIHLKNEGTYRVQTMEEAQTESDYHRDYVFELDARQAFIGSVIFERKFF
jgi:hypothetical protein